MTTATKKAKTKMDQAREIFTRGQKLKTVRTRKATMSLFQDKIGMTEACAGTYYHNIQKEATAVA